MELEKELSIQKKPLKSKSLFENNYTDIKNFYINYLIYLLKPSLIDGIIGLYKEVENIKNTKNINKIQLFKESLKNIKYLKSNQIMNFVISIKDNTQSGEILEKTIKAVLKSYIILLTYNNSDKTVKLLGEKYHKKVDINEFIYRCFVEFSQSIFLNVDVFIKYNANILNYSEYINDMIYSAIETTIFKTLPMSEILNYYLSDNVKTIEDNKETLTELTKLIISTLSNINNENTEKIIKLISDFINGYKQNNLYSFSKQQIIKTDKSDYKSLTVPIFKENIKTEKLKVKTDKI